MNDDDFKKNPAPTQNEGDARFDVSSLETKSRTKTATEFFT